MSIDSDSIAVTLMSLTASALLLFFTYRAFRITGNKGFLVLALALVLIPWVMDLVDGRLAIWIHQRGGSLRSFGMIQFAQLILTNSLLTWALILLARPLHRGRRV